MLAKELSRMVMSLASLATAVPSPMESPTCAALSAGASLVPSPVTATTSPPRCSIRTSRALSSGRARDMIFNALTRFRASSSDSAANSGPEMMASSGVSSCQSPTCRPTSRAVPGVSPVTIFTSTPARFTSAMAAGTSGLTGSLMATMPKKMSDDGSMTMVPSCVAGSSASSSR